MTGVAATAETVRSPLGRRALGGIIDVGVIAVFAWCALLALSAAVIPSPGGLNEDALVGQGLALAGLMFAVLAVTYIPWCRHRAGVTVGDRVLKLRGADCVAFPRRMRIVLIVIVTFDAFGLVGATAALLHAG